MVDGKLSILECARLSRGADRSSDGRAVLEAVISILGSARSGPASPRDGHADGCVVSPAVSPIVRDALYAASEAEMRGIDGRLTDVLGEPLTSQTGLEM